MTGDMLECQVCGEAYVSSEDGLDTDELCAACVQKQNSCGC
ncbi:MAG: hypothetical protein ACYCW6_10365 [Candidatus Xenobia bacterium]